MNKKEKDAFLTKVIKDDKQTIVQVQNRFWKIVDVNLYKAKRMAKTDWAMILWDEYNEVAKEVVELTNRVNELEKENATLKANQKTKAQPKVTKAK